MEKLLPFEYVIRKTTINDGKFVRKPHLLLGNGFSIAYNDNFKFQTLLEFADLHQIFPDPRIPMLFERLEESDFESIMKSLDTTRDIVDFYKSNTSFSHPINSVEELIHITEADSTVLKDCLCKAIGAIHPDSLQEAPHGATNNANQHALNIESAANFLKHFHFIFTLNYDLLLYWSVMSKTSGEFSD